MAIAENFDDKPSGRFNAWLDLPPSAEEILRRLQDPKAFRQTADKYVTYLQNNPNAVLLRPDQLLFLGRNLEMDFKIEQALVIYQIYSVQFPERNEGWVAQAKLEKQRGNLARALVLLQEALTTTDCYRADIEAELVYLRYSLYAQEKL